MKIKKKRDFIVSNRRDYKDKCDNYVEALPKHKEPLNLSDEQITEYTTKVLGVAGIIQEKLDLEHQLKSLTKKVDTEIEDLNQFLRNQRNEFLQLADFTDDICVDLGFDIKTIEVDCDDLKPELTVYISSGYPTIKYSKQGTDGIKIYSRKNNEHFRLLDFTPETRYIDTTARKEEGQEEYREYYAMFTYKGKLIGKKSDVHGIKV
jgi:uncharacterized protein YeeX (DUF496 family)